MTIWASLIIQKKKVLGGWREPRKKWFSKGGKSSIFYVLKRTWYIILNFTARRCLCVGNAGRSEVPNRNSICIPSVRKMNVWNTWYTNCRDFAYPTPHRTTTRIFLHAKFSARKKKCLIAKLDFLLNLKFEELRKIPQKSLAQFLSQEHRKTAFDLKMVVDQPCCDLAQCF